MPIEIDISSHYPTAPSVGSEESPRLPVMAEIPLDSSDSAASAAPPVRTAGWSIAILCFGLGIIAACVIVPQTDANRRLAYERQKLRQDLQQIQKQVALNQEFLKMIETDPQLAERVARRQMRVVRQGETVLDIQPDSDPTASAADQMSPFQIIKVPPPPPMAPYRSVGGLLNDLCLNPHAQIYLLGGGLLLAAAGLILGDSSRASDVRVSQ